MLLFILNDFQEIFVHCLNIHVVKVWPIVPFCLVFKLRTDQAFAGALMVFYTGNRATSAGINVDFVVVIFDRLDHKLNTPAIPLNLSGVVK